MTHDAVLHGANIARIAGARRQWRVRTDCAQFDELVRDADAGRRGRPAYNCGILRRATPSPNTQTMTARRRTRSDCQWSSEIFRARWPQTYGLYADGPIRCAISPAVALSGRTASSMIGGSRSESASDASAGCAREAAMAGRPSEDLTFTGARVWPARMPAGAAAVFVTILQEHAHNASALRPALVKAGPIILADEMDQSLRTRTVPNNDEGWGR